MSGDTAICVIVPLFVAVAIAVFAWRLSRSRSILDQWAEDNGYRIVHRERRLLFRGPFWWRTAEGQEVFRVIVQDDEGRERAGYVRCGGWFLGLFSDAATVKWDDER